MIAIGVGCRKACPSEEIVAIVRQALAGLPDPGRSLGLFTVASKRGERGLEQAADALGLPLLFLDAAVMRSMVGGAKSCSTRIEALYGLPSIAETAALAGAGEGAVLLVSRVSNAVATCAIAGRR